MSACLLAPRRPSWICVLVFLLLIPACSSGPSSDPVVPGTGDDLGVPQAASSAGYIPWGFCDLVIARDGSDWEVIPRRGADGTWGMHLNAVPLLEVSPGKNCIRITQVQVQPDGDLAIDISITHPYNNAAYTGFDVRAIIMFPSSQFLPDNELLEKAGKPPCGNVDQWFASYRKGDAELMNPDGHTIIWSPFDVEAQRNRFELEEGYPIFGYYEGWMASGEHVGTINGFKHYYTNENRHMFEFGKTATRTFVIRPPAEGPIRASYAVYAHWAEPLVMPVTNPATQFGPEANSPLPYEFRIEQVGPVDPDAPYDVTAESVIWHIKTWNFGIDCWWEGWQDVVGGGGGSGDIWLMEAFDECPDCYRLNKFSVSYGIVPDILPGTWPVKFHLRVDPDGYPPFPILASDYYIAWLDIEAADGEW